MTEILGRPGIPNSPTGKYESPSADFGGDSDRDEEKRKQAEEFYGQNREEEYARRDRVLNRLMNAENPQDVAASLELIRDYEGVHFGETIDRFTFNAYKKTALEGQRAFEKGSKDVNDLTKEGIVVGKIGSNGFLERGGRVKASGYAIRVDREEVEITQKESKETSLVNPLTGERSAPQIVEETTRVRRPVEKIYFGTAQERKALARANEELHKILVTSEILQNQTILFDETRASLESMVKFFYQKQVYFTNLQTKWFFSASDISKMDADKPETLENTELGDRRDKAMRLYYLVGMCEQRGSFEKHLNETFNLEEILDYEGEDTKTIDRVLNIAEKHGYIKQEEIDNLANKDEKFKTAVRFLLGKNIKIEKDGNNNWKYTLEGWLTDDERDPMTTITKRRPDNTEYKKGAKSADQEAKDGLRGYLTEFGNPYAEGSRDNLYALMGRMNEIVGDDMAVTEAGRFFWTRGMRDELGAEVYTKKLPTGEELLDIFNKFSYEQWQEYCGKIKDCYAINGEPVCSDLSKIFWPKLWRLKEMMLDRSAGPYLTYDKFERLTQSELSLCRVRTESGELRSIREAWLGYKGRPSFNAEKAIDLGGIEWEQAGVPANVTEQASVEATELNKSAIQDNADGYFWVMNYLAGDDNPAKRPWQFIMKGVERFADLQRPEAYTDKIKFWKIVWHGPAITWGNWRERYQRNKLNGGDHVSKTEDEADKEASQKLDKAKKDWWDGIVSLPEYPIILTQDVRYVDDGGSTRSTTLIKLIEPLARRFGFINDSTAGRAPGYIRRIKLKI